LSYYANDEEDPYITLKDVSSSKFRPNNQEAAVSEDEREELQILPSDNLVVAAKTEDDVSYLEVYVYESAEDNIYVHHDIMLPSLPLCVEWLNYNVNTSAEDDGTRRGNMVAVGTFDPDIEVWDLDLVESMYPDAILGAAADKGNELHSPAKKGKKKKKKQKVANDKFHVDAVMCLSANRLQRNLLLSGSADSTIKLWDLTAGSSSSCVKSYSSHKDKVSAIQWHPTEAFYALSGSYDRVVTVMDFRTTNGTGANWKFDSDIEGVRWDPHDPNYFYVSPLNRSSNVRCQRTMVSYITMM
jgi:periodic tryptophan protein 1